MEFKKATAALKEMDMDELTAVRSSFKTAEIAGLSKQKLLQAAEHYLKVLDKEKNQFSEAMKNQYQEMIMVFIPLFKLPMLPSPSK